MFLLPSIILGVAFALLLGGKPSRILDIEFRYGWTVFAALGLQVVLFSGARDLIPEPLLEPLHLGTYVLLFWFAFANFRNLILLPLFLGMALNAIAILSNGGRMPVNQEAWDEHRPRQAPRTRTSRSAPTGSPSSATSSRSRASCPSRTSSRSATSCSGSGR